MIQMLIITFRLNLCVEIVRRTLKHTHPILNGDDWIYVKKSYSELNSNIYYLQMIENVRVACLSSTSTSTKEQFKLMCNNIYYFTCELLP